MSGVAGTERACLRGMPNTDAHPQYEILVSLVLCENSISHVRYSIKAVGGKLSIIQKI